MPEEDDAWLIEDDNSVRRVSGGDTVSKVGNLRDKDWSPTGEGNNDNLNIWEGVSLLEFEISKLWMFALICSKESEMLKMPGAQ